jgi:hypothetical protein
LLPPAGGSMIGLARSCASEPTMRIKRRPKTHRSWTPTDSKAASAIARSWRPRTTIDFDGTIEKLGERHTRMGVEMDEDDVLALHSGLIAHYRAIEKQRDDLRKRERELMRAFRKLHKLVSDARARAPNDEALVGAVEQIAGHFSGANRRRPFKSRFRWLSWRTL